jgi:hypothetical protein
MVNTSANATYSIDDRLILKNAPPGIHLRFRTSCARGEAREQFSNTLSEQTEYALIEFLPPSFLYSARGEPLKQVTCALEISAVNSQGSRQTFPTLNLVMNDMSINKLELLYNMRELSKEKPQILMSTEFSKVQLPVMTADETFLLQCETFSAISTDKYVRDLSDLKINAGKLEANAQNPQYCRVLKLNSGSTKMVSPFFILQFFDPTGILKENDNTILYPHVTGPEVVTVPIFRKQKIVNPYSKDIFLRIPKFVATDAVTKTTGETFLWSPYLKISADIPVTIDENDYFVITLKPGHGTLLSYTLNNTLICRYPIISIEVSAKKPLVQISAVDRQNKIILATWEIVNEQFAPLISTFPVPHHGDNSTVRPTSCRVN